MFKSETVTIRLSAEIKGKLEALAASTNRSKSWLAAQAIASYVEEESWQIQQIEEAVVLADSDRAVLGLSRELCKTPSPISTGLNLTIPQRAAVARQLSADPPVFGAGV
jgi:predicted transcriptional regulator